MTTSLAKCKQVFGHALLDVLQQFAYLCDILKYVNGLIILKKDDRQFTLTSKKVAFDLQAKRLCHTLLYRQFQQRTVFASPCRISSTNIDTTHLQPCQSDSRTVSVVCHPMQTESWQLQCLLQTQLTHSHQINCTRMLQLHRVPTGARKVNAPTFLWLFQTCRAISTDSLRPHTKCLKLCNGAHTPFVASKTLHFETKTWSTL